MHLFSKFPAEIQIKIWKYTFPGKRIVRVKYNAEEEAYMSSANPPVALFVCKQSRDEAKKFWQLTFGSTVDNGRIWVSFDIDQVFVMPTIRNPFDLEKFVMHTEGAQRLKELAVYISKTEPYERSPITILIGFGKRLSDRMPRLEQVWLVRNFDCSDSLKDGASGVIVSCHKLDRIHSGDLSLAPHVVVPQESVVSWRSAHVYGTNPVHYGRAVLEYRNQPMVEAVVYDLEPQGIRPIVQIDSRRGLLDPFLFKAIDGFFCNRTRAF